MMSAKSHLPAAFYWKKRLQRNSAGGIIRVRGVIHGSHRRRKEDQEHPEKEEPDPPGGFGKERHVRHRDQRDRGERLATDIPNVDFQSLAHGVPGQRFHPKLGILKPGANSGEDFVNHQGDGFFLVIRGALEMEINGTSVRLEEGDSLYVRGNTPYRWKNASGQEETHLLVVSAS